MRVSRHREGENYGSRCMRYHRHEGQAVSGQWDGTMADALTTWPSRLVCILSEKDTLGQHQLMLISFKMIYVSLLRLHIFVPSDFHLLRKCANNKGMPECKQI